MKTAVIVCVICVAPLVAQQKAMPAKGGTQPKAAQPKAAQESPALQQVQTLPLKAEGRLGHLAVDVRSGRLFVAATDANTVEVFDLKQGNLLQTVTGFDKPEDVLVIPGSTQPGFAKIYVSNADGKIRILDTVSWQVVKTIELGGTGGRLVYDTAAKRIYAGAGSDSLAIIDPASGNKISEIKVDGHPESFQLEKTGSRIFVDVPEAKAVSVVDRKKPGTPTKVPVTWAEGNYPMALDEAHHRLLVVARKPAKLLVLDTVSLKWITELPLSDDIDDLFYDAAVKRVYVISGLAIMPPDRVGVVYALDQVDPDHYMVKQKVVTAIGAHTGAFAPELRRLYVALPGTTGKPGELRVYEAK